MKNLFKCFMIFLLVLFIALPNASVASASAGKSINIKGVALSEIPNKTHKNKLVEIPSNLKLNSYKFNGDSLQIDGEIKYKNIDHSFNVKGKPFQSSLKESDVIFNVEDQDVEGDLKVVFFKLFQDPKDIDLVANKFLAGKKTLTLYLFDETKRDLISFNIPAEELGLQDINGVNYPTDDKVSDAWVYKVMEGELSVNDDDNTYSIAAGVSKSDVKNFSANITYINPYGNGCNEQHAKNGVVSIVGSTILGDQNYLTTNVRVNSQGITYNCSSGSYKYVAGESAIWIGSYSNPVKIDNTFSGTSYVDFVKKTRWWGSYNERSVYGIDVGLSVGYGPITAGSTIASWKNYKPAFNTTQTVYFGGTEYSRKSNFTFTDSRLYNNNQYYSAETTLGVAKATTSNSKKVSATVKLPIYGNTGGTYYETKYYYPSLSYSNY